jgi:hypothetical protein
VKTAFTKADGTQNLRRMNWKLRRLSYVVTSISMKTHRCQQKWNDFNCGNGVSENRPEDLNARETQDTKHSGREEDPPPPATEQLATEPAAAAEAEKAIPGGTNSDHRELSAHSEAKRDRVPPEYSNKWI